MTKIFIFLCFLLAVSTLVNCAAVEKEEEEKQEEAIAAVEEQHEAAEDDDDDDDDLEHPFHPFYPYDLCYPGHPIRPCLEADEYIADSHCCRYFYRCDHLQVPHRLTCPPFTCYAPHVHACASFHPFY